MTKKKNTNQNGFAKSWKNLAPKSSRRPISSAAMRKKILFLSKFFLLILILSSVGVGSWFLKNRTTFASGPIDITGPGLPIARVSFVSDGVLHSEWFNNWFGPLRGRTLMDIDIERVQNDLMAEKQVAFARVSRNFPDTLKIEIREKFPVLRLCLRTKAKGEQTWLVASDGSLYLGYGYNRASLRHLPFLSVNPKLLKPLADQEGYENLAGISKVAPLLSVARRDYPGIYQNWQIVSYERPDQKDPGAHISVKSKKIKKLRFAPSDFANQLRRLKYLLNEPDFKRATVIESIDLSHDRSVFAKL